MREAEHMQCHDSLQALLWRMRRQRLPSSQSCFPHTRLRVRATLHLFACLFIRGGGRTKAIVQKMPRFVQTALDSIAAYAVESGLVLTPSRLPAAASQVAALIGRGIWCSDTPYSNRILGMILRHVWDRYLLEGRALAWKYSFFSGG
jgi:hypothetical protein